MYYIIFVPTEGVETILLGQGSFRTEVEASRRIDDLKAARRYKHGELLVRTRITGRGRR
jgi:hypothetical protein